MQEMYAIPFGRSPPERVPTSTEALGASVTAVLSGLFVIVTSTGNGAGAAVTRSMPGDSVGANVSTGGLFAPGSTAFGISDGIADGSVDANVATFSAGTSS
mmetsp:Transcript_8065/g.17429  ORF Transcript_8065/g.17429 Transcript_8065/m.17429 type:complete len:101 (-) Transcript_8065:469-771(-)